MAKDKGHKAARETAPIPSRTTIATGLMMPPRPKVLLSHSMRWVLYRKRLQKSWRRLDLEVPLPMHWSLGSRLKRPSQQQPHLLHNQQPLLSSRLNHQSTSLHHRLLCHKHTSLLLLNSFQMTR